MINYRDALQIDTTLMKPTAFQNVCLINVSNELNLFYFSDNYSRSPRHINTKSYVEIRR